MKFRVESVDFILLYAFKLRFDIAVKLGIRDLKKLIHILLCRASFLYRILIDIVPGLRYDPRTSLLCQLVICAVFHFVTLVSTFRGTRSCTKSPGDHSDNSFIMSQTPALQPSLGFPGGVRNGTDDSVF